MTNNNAIFAAGCFWGVQQVFDNIKGVLYTKVGYTGGISSNPSYEEVCSSNTGHAKSIKITFNPQMISYKDLLYSFWDCHDPTTLNRQGPDIGSQYRSTIFYLDESQKIIAINSKENASSKFKNSIVTEIVKASKFYLAEEYHQKYLEKKT